MGRQVLKIEENIFEELRGLFNTILTQVLGKMHEQENDESVINIKMQITLHNEVDDYGQPYEQPVFKYDVSSEIKEKIKASGGIFQNSQLRFNESGNFYEVTEIPTRQMKLV